MIECYEDDDVDLVYTIVDKNGDAVTVTGGSATCNIASDTNDSPLLALVSPTDITLSGSTVTVSFNAADIGATGKFFVHLRLTVSGKSSIASEEKFLVKSRID